MKMREMIRRLRLYTNPITGNNDMGMIKTEQEPVVEAMEAAPPVGSSAPVASIADAVVGKFLCFEISEIYSKLAAFV